MPFPLYDTELSRLQIAVFDLETTGLFPANDRILQIAMVPIANGEIESGEKEWKINPGDDVVIHEEILKLTGLDEQELRRSPKIDVVLPQFGDVVGHRIVAGHNVKRFDLPFVRRAESRLNIDVQTDLYIDTLMLAKKLKPNQANHKLNTCSSEYQLEFAEEELHDALADTRLCAKVLLKQIEDLAGQGVHTFGEMIDFLS